MLGILGYEQEAMRIMLNSGRKEILDLSLQHSARDCAIRGLLAVETHFLDISHRRNKKIAISAGVAIDTADVADAVVIGFSSEIRQETPVENRVFLCGGFNTNVKFKTPQKQYAKPSFCYGSGARDFNAIEKFKFVSPEKYHDYLIPYMNLCIGVFEQLQDSGYICIGMLSTSEPGLSEEHYFTFFNPHAHYSFVEFGYVPSILESDAKYLDELTQASRI